MLTRAEFAKLVAGLLLSIAACFQIHRAALAFSNIYGSLSATLPAYKQILIAYHPIIYLLPVFALLTWSMPKLRGRVGTFTLASGIAVFLCLLLFLAVFSWPSTPILTTA